MKTPTGSARGFSIMELITVLFVISVLVALSSSHYTQATKRAASIEAITTVNAIEKALREYYLRFGEFPPVGGDPNPPGADGNRMPMVDNLPGWQTIAFKPDGAYRYQYHFIPERSADGRYEKVRIFAMGNFTDSGTPLHVFERELVAGERSPFDYDSTDSNDGTDGKE